MLADRPLLVLVLASTVALAGCAAPGGSGEELENASMTLAPGTNASTPLLFSQADAEPSEASLSVEDAAGLDVEAPETLHGNETGAIAGWLTVSVPEDASEGDHEVVVSLSDADGQITEAVVPITVETPSEPLKPGEVGMLQLTARTQDGALAITNDQAVAEAPFPEAEGYQDPQQFQPIPAPLTPRGQLPSQLVQAVVGTDVNHSLSVDVPEVFGPAQIENERAREETVEREVQIPVEIDVPTRQAQQFLPRDAQEGDEVDLPVVQNASAGVPYTVESLTQQQVSFDLALEESETLTLYQAWTHGANVTEVRAEQATLYVTPTQSEGETLTWVEPWGNTTEIVEVTNETITLRHDPEPGLTYTTQNRQSQQPVETTVVEVTEDTIVLSQDNPHPLAGETLSFDVTVLDRQQAPQRAPQGGQPSPR